MERHHKILIFFIHIWPKSNWQSRHVILIIFCCLDPSTFHMLTCWTHPLMFLQPCWLLKACHPTAFEPLSARIFVDTMHRLHGREGWGLVRWCLLNSNCLRQGGLGARRFWKPILEYEFFKTIGPVYWNLPWATWLGHPLSAFLNPHRFDIAMVKTHRFLTPPGGSPDSSGMVFAWQVVEMQAKDYDKKNRLFVKIIRGTSATKKLV